MGDNIRKYYFTIIKAVFMIMLLIYYFIQYPKNGGEEVGLFILHIVLLVCIMFTELLEQRHWQILICQVFVLLLFYIFYGIMYTLALPFLILEIIVYAKIKPGFYLLVFFCSFIYINNLIPYLVISIVVVCLYFQHYIIIKEYKDLMDYYQSNENRLRENMDEMDNRYKRELKESHMSYENQMLEEKNRISQALHDKLGHSINGSVYQLEAAKALLEKEPDHSKSILQGVIDNLRGSMDEIRAILRKERPTKSRMALLQLQGLCADCINKYNIDASITLSGDRDKIPEMIWNVILDNSIEAVSNALKYADCTTLTIKILVLNKLVRCNIVDDGRGCTDIQDGMGLQGMRRRVRQVNGVFDITSSDGFSINMLLPFE